MVAHIVNGSNERGDTQNCLVLALNNHIMFYLVQQNRKEFLVVFPVIVSVLRFINTVHVVQYMVIRINNKLCRLCKSEYEKKA